MAPRNYQPIIISNKLSTGAIVGISVGASVAGLLILCLFFLWMRQRRAIRIRSIPSHRAAVKPKRSDSKHKIEPFSPSSSNTPMLNVTTPPPGHTPWVIEHGPVGGDGNGYGNGDGVQATGLAYSTSQSSEHGPRRRSSAGIRRKQDEAAGLTSVPVHRRPSSSTPSEYQPLVAPQTPRTPHTPHTPTPSVPPTPMSPGSVTSGTGGTTGTGANGATGANGRAQSTQIHYHIHLSPGAAAEASFPPGAIIHEYGDEPAPEYEERPRSADGNHTILTTSSPPPTAAHQDSFT